MKQLQIKTVTELLLKLNCDKCAMASQCGQQISF